MVTKTSVPDGITARLLFLVEIPIDNTWLLFTKYSQSETSRCESDINTKNPHNI